MFVLTFADVRFGTDAAVAVKKPKQQDGAWELVTWGSTAKGGEVTAYALREGRKGVKGKSSLPCELHRIITNACSPSSGRRGSMILSLIVSACASPWCACVCACLGCACGATTPDECALAKRRRASQLDCSSVIVP